MVIASLEQNGRIEIIKIRPKYPADNKDLSGFYTEILKLKNEARRADYRPEPLENPFHCVAPPATQKFATETIERYTTNMSFLHGRTNSDAEFRGLLDHTFGELSRHAQFGHWVGPHYRGIFDIYSHPQTALYCTYSMCTLGCQLLPGRTVDFNHADWFVVRVAKELRRQSRLICTFCLSKCHKFCSWDLDVQDK